MQCTGGGAVPSELGEYCYGKRETGILRDETSVGDVQSFEQTKPTGACTKLLAYSADAKYHLPHSLSRTD